MSEDNLGIRVAPGVRVRCLGTSSSQAMAEGQMFGGSNEVGSYSACLVGSVKYLLIRLASLERGSVAQYLVLIQHPDKFALCGRYLVLVPCLELLLNYCHYPN
jgi:hypothetical protein